MYKDMKKTERRIFIMFDMFNREGNLATIKKITRKEVQNQNYVYTFSLSFDPQTTGNQVQTTKATAFVNPKKFPSIKTVYDKMMVGDQVIAKLYQKGQYVDVYNLTLTDFVENHEDQDEAAQVPASQTSVQVNDDDIPASDINFDEINF